MMQSNGQSSKPLCKDLAAAILKSRQKATQETLKWKRKAEELSSQVQILSDAVRDISRQQKCKHEEFSDAFAQPSDDLLVSGQTSRSSQSL
jgi:hypothetical protein